MDATNEQDVFLLWQQTSSRYVRVGYSPRMGAVSPPPPGAGPRYRSQCCIWPTRRSPTINSSPLNSTTHHHHHHHHLIHGCMIASPMNADLGHQSCLHRPRDYASTTTPVPSLFSSPHASTTLDRLPRFRFGGNRTTSSKSPRVQDRLRHTPVPPPRIRHVTPPATRSSCDAPLRATSFTTTQLDYSPPPTPTGSVSHLDSLYEMLKSEQPERRKDKLRRRKGVYLPQWPQPYAELVDFDTNEQQRASDGWELTPRTDSLSEGELELLDALTSDADSLSRDDRSSHNELDESVSIDKRDESSPLELRDSSCAGGAHSSDNVSLASLQFDHQLPPHNQLRVLTHHHQRTTSSPSKLEGAAFASTSTSSAISSSNNDFLDQLLRAGSTEQLSTERNKSDTRNHIMAEMLENEESYVEALTNVTIKYAEPLKNPENSQLLDAALVDEIFCQIPVMLEHHQHFCKSLKAKIEAKDEITPSIGDNLLTLLSHPELIESYVQYVNNWSHCQEIIKNAQSNKVAFAKFLENTARENKGKLTLDALLIKPVQKIPKYEMLIHRLLKHTAKGTEDYGRLLLAKRVVRKQLLTINGIEEDTSNIDELKELESMVDGLVGIVDVDRHVLRKDLVVATTDTAARKDRGLFLLSDLLLLTSVKRRNGTMLWQQSSLSQLGILDANRHRLVTKIPLAKLEIDHSRDSSCRSFDMDTIAEDINMLNKMLELAANLHTQHNPLDEMLRAMSGALSRQLQDYQANDSQVSTLVLLVDQTNGTERMSVEFAQPELRASWEITFNDAKQRLGERLPIPDLVSAVPIRKTRAGLQFTCAAPTGKEVWVCNSDGYVGQVCVLKLGAEPTVISCNGVCSARILCIAAVPAAVVGQRATSETGCAAGGDICSRSHLVKIPATSSLETCSSNIVDEVDDAPVQSFDDTDNKTPSTSSTDCIDSNLDLDEINTQRPTMWLGTEDGCIHIYNSTHNIRIKKNKIRLQHGFSVLSIVYGLLIRYTGCCVLAFSDKHVCVCVCCYFDRYLDHKVFVSLSNGDIVIYSRDASLYWNVSSPLLVSVGTPSSPITIMIAYGGASKLWCASGNTVRLFNGDTTLTESNFVVTSDTNKTITCLAYCEAGLWLTFHYCATIKCFNCSTFQCVLEVNVAPTVTKMLTGCDDIIRQHKAACLRVTSMLACKNLLWIGTSAGVLLTMPLPLAFNSSASKANALANITGIPYGHTGHVRFLTCAERSEPEEGTKSAEDETPPVRLLVISGGDGYEDFRHPNLSDVAGREDSTNHLLLWNV